MNNENIPAPAEQKFSFRKALGGFKKEDVISFISEENRKFNEERSALNAQLAEQTAKAEDAVKKSSEFQLYYELLLKKKADELAKKDAEIEEAKQAAAGFSEKEGALNAEIEKLRSEAASIPEATEDYEGTISALKERCADAEAAIASVKEEDEAKLAIAKADCESKDAKYEQLAAKCAKLEAKCRDLESLAAEKASDTSASDALKAENEKLKKMYGEAAEKLAAAEKVTAPAAEAEKKEEAPAFEKKGAKMPTKFVRIPKGTDPETIRKMLGRK